MQFGLIKSNDNNENINSTDPRRVKLKWKDVANADGYLIRFGVASDKLYNHYQILDKKVTEYEITTLTVGTKYYYAIDSYNVNGVTKGSNMLSDK